MFFDEAAAEFGWPGSDVSSLSPAAALACRKLQNRLQAKGLLQARVLSRSGGGQSQHLAIVCEFARHPGLATFKEAHALAWNLCEGEQIIFLVADQRMIQGWSCLVPPSQWEDALLGEETSLEPNVDVLSPQHQVLRAFQWVNLAGGYLQEKLSAKFNPELRADRLLVKNLREVRRVLINWEIEPEHALSRETCHSLLARLIFVQYLFQRTDSQGRAFLDSGVLAKLVGQGVLSQQHSSLSEILRHKSDTYALFRWLNVRFNGDLFPKDGTATFSREEKDVRAAHLRCLSDYLGGRTELSSGQGLLWQHYSFEAIPISFISSLYEEFLTEDERGENKAFYTPHFLVDFILDTALPWESDEWDIRILDPCCGSGIFLVKAFQRLVHRWRRANRGETISVSTLKRLLRRNVIGLDVNPEAIRVASFSLCLAMADEIDPRQYWQTTVFPPLRGISLIDGDFFDPDIDTNQPLAGGEFDIVLGNPPWGKNSAKEFARKWAKATDWVLSYGDVGPLFIAKALTKLKSGGDIAMIQPTSLLMNQSGPLQKFRTRLFSTARAVEVNNFSALRFGFFSRSVGPCCVLYLSNTPPCNDDRITYLSPKQSGVDYIQIEPGDWQQVYLREALNDSWIWTALTWGERRNIELMRRLGVMPTIDSLLAKKQLHTREGVIRGNRAHKSPLPPGRKFLAQLTADPLLPLSADSLETNTDLEHHSGDSSDYGAFAFPQLIIKQSWVVRTRRFAAALVQKGNQTDGILCSDSFVSIHAEPDTLYQIWMAFNSRFAVWWQMLRSGQFSTFIPKPLERELRQVPIPNLDSSSLRMPRTFHELDQTVYHSFHLSEIERALIDDLVDYTLSDFKDGPKSVGRACTSRKASDDPLSQYVSWIFRVLRSGFGDRPLAATVFREADMNMRLPLRLCAIHLDCESEGITQVEISDGDLLHLLRDLHIKVFNCGRDKQVGVCTERHLRYYDNFAPQSGGRPVPTVFIAKPDRCGLWTRTQAMRDADEITADILSNASEAP